MTAREHVLRRRLVFATHEAQSAEEASRCHCEAHYGDIKRAPGTGPKMSKMGDAASPAATGGQHKEQRVGVSNSSIFGAPWECL